MEPLPPSEHHHDSTIVTGFANANPVEPAAIVHVETAVDGIAAASTENDQDAPAAEPKKRARR